MNISINQTNCTRCLKCMKACPAEILRFDKDAKQVSVHKPERCIVCGHCTASCEFEALDHSEFPTGTVHKLDHSLYPTPQQMMEIIRGRRSNRAFSEKPIPTEKLDMILEAAYRAPTASNLQMVEFTLVTDPKKLKTISEFTMNVFGGVLKMIDNPFVKPIVKLASPSLLRYIPLFKKMQREYANGRDGVLRGATAVLLIHTPKECRFGIEDSNLAYQNASLMAEALEVSQFYTGFVLNATKQKKGKLEQQLGINGTIHAGMAMALPAFRMSNYIDKKPMRASKL